MASNIINVSLGDEDLGVFDYTKYTILDAIAVKAESARLGTALTYKAFLDGVAEMDPQALQVFVWLLRRRKGQISDAASINFAIVDLKLEEAPDPTPAATPTTSGPAAADTSVSLPTSAT